MVSQIKGRGHSFQQTETQRLVYRFGFDDHQHFNHDIAINFFKYTEYQDNCAITVFMVYTELARSRTMLVETGPSPVGREVPGVTLRHAGAVQTPPRRCLPY